MRKSTRFLALVLLTAACAAQADTVYKWVDKDGTVHYSAQPSTEHKSTTIEVRPGRAAEVPSAAPAAEEGGQADEAALRAKYCESATRNYQILTQTERPVKTRGDYGEERTLGAEERQAEAAKHKQAMEEYCAPPSEEAG